MEQYGKVRNDWPTTMKPGWAERNRARMLEFAQRPDPRDGQAFAWCDAHPATGGPHKTRGVFVGRYFDTNATVWACTHLSKRGTVCGSLQLAV